MGGKTAIRYGGIAGIVFGLLLLASSFAGGGAPPDIGASGKDVLAYYGGSGARLGYILGAALPTVFAAWFFPTLTLILWSQASARVYALIGLAAVAITGAAATATDVVTWGPLVYGQVDENVAKALNNAMATSHVGVQALIFAAAGAYGLAQTKAGGPWRWAGYVAYLAAVVTAIGFVASLGTGSNGILGLVGLLAFILWSLVSGGVQASREWAQVNSP